MQTIFKPATEVEHDNRLKEISSVSIDAMCKSCCIKRTAEIEKLLLNIIKLKGRHVSVDNLYSKRVYGNFWEGFERFITLDFRWSDTTHQHFPGHITEITIDKNTDSIIKLKELTIRDNFHEYIEHIYHSVISRYPIFSTFDLNEIKTKIFEIINIPESEYNLYEFKNGFNIQCCNSKKILDGYVFIAHANGTTVNKRLNDNKWNLIASRENGEIYYHENE